MNKFLLPLFLIISSFAFGQGTPCPNYQQFGSGTTRTAILGLAQGQKGVTIGRYTDTTTANSSGCADYYPGTVIITDNPVDVLWQRNFNATKWISRGSSGDIQSFTFITDSSIVICFADGSCDTIPINNFTEIVNNIVQNFNDSTVYNINDSTLIICNAAGSCDTIDLRNSNNYYFLNDSTLVTCDTLETICIGDSCYQQRICDTIPIPKLGAALQFQEGLYKIPNTPIVELGFVNQGEGGPSLYRNTYLYASPGYLTIDGKLLAHEPLVVQQRMVVEESPSIQSWFHVGRGYSSGIANPNTVSLYMNYADRISESTYVPGDTVGVFGDRVGYLQMTNSRGARYSFQVDDLYAKQVGILYHTKDMGNRDAVTIFGQQYPSGYPLALNPQVDSTLFDQRIAIFKTDKEIQFPGYPETRDDGPAPKAFYTDADGNLKLGPIAGSGDIITIINDTTINICSFGTDLCDTITINNIGVIQTVFILNDSTLVVCDTVGVCDTLIISSTNFSQPITARNGLIMATPTEVQFGQGIGAPGNPAILLSNREIPLANFTINFNASAVQSNNMTVWKNAAAAIRARVTAAASYSNTGGQTQSEIFGDGANVGGTNATAIGYTASALITGSMAIGTNTTASTLAGATAVGTGATALGGTAFGNGALNTGNSSVTIGKSAITTADGGTALGAGAVAGANALSLGAAASATVNAATAVGYGSSAAFAQSIALGHGAVTTATKQMVVGEDFGGVTNVYIGSGVLSTTPESFTLNASGGSGANVGGASNTIAGGKGTGNATPGFVNIATSVIGSSGSTLQTLATRAIISDKSFNINATRFEEYKGANVVAANDVTLGIDGNLFTITGSTQINAITTANWQAGSTIGFIFTGAPLVKHNTAGGAGTATMLLAGSADFQAAAGDNIEFRYDGTNWHEIGRTLAASGSVTANSGLRMSTPTNVQLGATASGSANSPLLQNSYINTNTLRLYVYGESATLPPLTANNFSGGPAFHAVSTTGPAVYAQTNSGTPINSTLTASSQNSSLEILRLNRETTGGGGVGQVGIGAYIDMLLHTSTTAGQLATRFNTEYTVVTHGSQTSKLTISGVNGGSTVEALVLGGEGYVKLRPITATAASAITPAEGMLVFVSNTDATFVSIGIWCYQNGAWKAL